jgi:spoIIIJ-associated protein
MDKLEHLESRLKSFLDALVAEGEFRLTYKLVRPGAEGNTERDFENPDLIVDFEGADGDLLLANGAELLRSFEHLAHEVLGLHADEHARIVFDCRNRRMLRMNELETAARMAADRVLKTGVKYEFSPMNSRERRILHLALREFKGISSDSEGVGPNRHVVVQIERRAGVGGPRRGQRL